VPAGLCTKPNREDTGEAAQTQTDKLQAGLRILTPGLSKDFGKPNYDFVVAHSVSTFIRLGTLVIRVFAVA
jgi:hypothetical protein